MNTKYQELKNRIKANAEFTRILKNHRKTVRFQGERLQNLKVNGAIRDPKNWKYNDAEVTISTLTPEIATSILNGESFHNNGQQCWVNNPSSDNASLFEIYGILRNERKTKKVKVWEDLVNSDWYHGSSLEKEVNSWRDEETVCADKQ